jgi:hypothetical protein
MENLMKNPSKRSVDQVYGFLEKNNLPITEDGCFLAFKKVRRDYLDIHSGTIDNSIGQVVEMDRNLVDDNPDSHCSSGLHFCSESYLGSFGGGSDPVMILKIDPADVVSIPTDYNGAKGRCCKYEVIAQVNGQPKDAFATVVDKTYAKPTVQMPPSAAWPFATKADVWPVPKAAKAPVKVVKGNGTYSVERMRGGDLVDTGMTLQQARDKVAANIRHKKAMLIIRDQNGNIVK